MSALPRKPSRRTAPARKRRGGQPSNANAFKHGFYSAHFKARERQLLEQLPAIDLAGEIELLRVTSARFLQAMAASKDPDDFEAHLAALRAVNLSAQSIAMLLRVQALTGSLSSYTDEERAAIEAMFRDSPAVEPTTENKTDAKTDADSWGFVPAS